MKPPTVLESLLLLLRTVHFLDDGEMASMILRRGVQEIAKRESRKLARLKPTTRRPAARKVAARAATQSR